MHAFPFSFSGFPQTLWYTSIKTDSFQDYTSHGITILSLVLWTVTWSVCMDLREIHVSALCYMYTVKLQTTRSPNSVKVITLLIKFSYLFRLLRFTFPFLVFLVSDTFLSYGLFDLSKCRIPLVFSFLQGFLLSLNNLEELSFCFADQIFSLFFLGLFMCFLPKLHSRSKTLRLLAIYLLLLET